MNVNALVVLVRCVVRKYQEGGGDKRLDGGLIDSSRNLIEKVPYDWYVYQ